MFCPWICDHWRLGRGRNAFREECERDRRSKIIDHFSESTTRDKSAPWTTIPSSLFVDDVIYRLNGNYGTLEDTQAGHRKGGSIQMKFSNLSLHCQSHLKIFNWYSSFFLLLSLRYHHHRLINSSRRGLSKPGHETLLKGFSNEFHAIVTCVAQALEMWDSDSLGLWINLHSSFGVHGTVEPSRPAIFSHIPSLPISLFTFSRFMFRSFG